MPDLKFTGLKEMQRSYAQAAKAMAAGEARAVRRVSTTIIAEQSRAIANTVNLRIGTIKKALTIVQQPTPAQPRVVFQVKRAGIPLDQFIGSRVTKAGLSVQPLKGGKRAVLKAGFTLKKAGGHYFGRVAKGGRKYGPPHVGRLPIVKLFGPDILSQYVKDAIQQVGIDTWRRRIEIELDRETTFALTQAGLL
jgi:hypothetical protein